MTDLAALYRHRFDTADLDRKRQIWAVLCRDFFSRHVPSDATVLDLACGYGEFINQIEAGTKIGVDLNPESETFLAADVRFHRSTANHLDAVESGSVDVVFASNFFEHLPTKAALDEVLKEAHRVLRPNGRILVMGPNIRCVPGSYWDFYDHHLPLSERSMGEGLAINGFTVEKTIARFLPYTTQSALPSHPALVALYLRVPLVWRFLGQQFFIVARTSS